MNTNKQTSREYFKSLKIIYYALIAGQLFFASTSLYLQLSGNFDTEVKDIRDVFLYVVPLFVIAGIFGSNYIFKIKIKAAKNKPNLMEKMFDYRGALIVRYALLEGPSFFCIVVYLMTGDIVFMGMFVLIIIIFLTINPSRHKAAKNLELNINDEQLINEPDEVIAEYKTN